LIEFIATRTAKICWIDATASCANNDAAFTLLLIWWFLQKKTEFY